MHLRKGQNADIEFGELNPQGARLFVGESCEAVPFAFRSVLAILGKHISDVFLLTGYEKMRRITATSYVASVRDDLPIMDRTIGEDVGDSMRPIGLTSVPELSVSIGGNKAIPQPTIIRSSNGNLSPEFDGVCAMWGAFTMMIVNESVCWFCDRLSAAAGAELWSVVRGIMEGHQKFLFWCQAGGTREVSPGAFIGIVQEYYSTSVQY